MANVDEVIDALRGVIEDLEDIQLPHGDDCRCEDCEGSGEDELAVEGKRLAEEVRLYHETNHQGAMQWCLTVCKKADELLELS